MATTTETRMTAKQRRVFHMLEEGKEPPEIAKAMKITRSGVYGHMRKMRAAGIQLPSEQSTNGHHSNGDAPSGLDRRDPVVASINENTKKAKDELVGVEHDIQQAERRLSELGVRQHQIEGRIESYERAREALLSTNGSSE